EVAENAAESKCESRGELEVRGNKSAPTTSHCWVVMLIAFLSLSLSLYTCCRTRCAKHRHDGGRVTAAGNRRQCWDSLDSVRGGGSIETAVHKRVDWIVLEI